MKLNWQRLIFCHVSENAINDLSEMILVSIFDISIDSISLTSTQSHERLCALQFRQYIHDEISFHSRNQIFLFCNVVFYCANDNHKRFFDSPIDFFPANSFFFVFNHVFKYPFYEKLQIVWFWFIFERLLNPFDNLSTSIVHKIS